MIVGRRIPPVVDFSGLGGGGGGDGSFVVRGA
jgi:hypothetical protein